MLNGIYAGILTAIMHPDVCGKVFTELRAGDFADGTEDGEFTQTCFEVAEELFNSGARIEPRIMTAKLESKYANADELQKLFEYYAADICVNTDTYITDVQNASRLRQIKQASEKLMFAKDIEEAEALCSELCLLQAPRTRGASDSGAQAANYFMDVLSDRAENGARCIDFGFYELDAALHAKAGNFIIIGARPSVGKSAFALSSALNMARSGKRVGFVSLEMNAEQIYDRCIAQMTGIELDKLLHAKELSTDDWKRTVEACEALCKLPITFCFDLSTVAQIRARALSEKWEVCFVDYLQLLDADSKGTRYEQVSQLSIALQHLAHQNGILVVALSQLKRPDAKEAATGPSLKDLRESGQIEQDADAVLLIGLEDANDTASSRTFNLAKNRQGACTRFNLKFDGKRQRFYRG